MRKLRASPATGVAVAAYPPQPQCITATGHEAGLVSLVSEVSENTFRLFFPLDFAIGGWKTYWE
jgi:hypothetical protein